MNKVAADRIAVVMKLTGANLVQAAQLVKAASDKALKARMEKQGRAWAGRQLSGLVRNIPGLNRAYTTKGPMTGLMSPKGVAHAMPERAGLADRAVRMGFKPMYGPRQFSGSRLAGVTAGAGATAVGGGHLWNDSQNTVGRSLNPITWFNPQSEEDVFGRNMEQYKGQANGMKDQILAARANGDNAGAEKLQAQYDSGNFGGSRWSLGGLNPFVSSNAGDYRKRATGIQAGIQGKYNSEMEKVGPRPGDDALVKSLEERLGRGDLLGPDEEIVRSQLAAVKGRMAAKPGTESPEAAAIRTRMQGIPGMRFTPWKAPGGATTPAGGAPYGNWHLGSRPRVPGGAQGFVMNPGDYRGPSTSPDNYWGPATAG